MSLNRKRAVLSAGLADGRFRSPPSLLLADLVSGAERQALQVWAALHGVITLAEQGLLTGGMAKVTREELVEDIVDQTKLALKAAIEQAGKST